MITEEDVARYIEGLMNDYESALSTKVETENLIHGLIIYMIKLDRRNREHKA